MVLLIRLLLARFHLPKELSKKLKRYSPNIILLLNGGLVAMAQAIVAVVRVIITMINKNQYSYYNNTQGQYQSYCPPIGP